MTNNNPQVIIGYGSGKSEVEAKQNALSDIVGKISVEIESSMNLHVEEDGREVLRHSAYETNQKSNGVLNDYKLLKMEFEDGRFYVAIWYENIPSFDKFVSKIKQNSGQIPPLVKIDSYLTHTQMAQKLKKALGREIDFKLLRKDKKWYIKSATLSQPLDKKDFRYFFATIPNDFLELKLSKNRSYLYDGEEFYFRVQVKESGFVSILTVYEDGTVSTLLRNIPVVKNRVENLPDKDFESIPEAGLIHKGVETYDMYVAIYSKKKLYFDGFAYADDTLIDEEKYKNFDRLIEFLDSKIFTTLHVITKPRN
jgi:hypothetical protein